jgi:phage repressor protein C with HTH and peptisase S24 domain
MDFAQLVIDRLTELNLNINQAEVRFGFSQGYLRGVVRNDEKRAVPSIEKAAAIAEALGINYQIGPAGRRPEFSIDGANYAQIPVHDAWLAAGPGYLNGDAEIIGHLAFRREWLTKMRISSGNARVARAHGLSMAPGIGDGDLVLLDTAKTLDDVPVRGPRDQRWPPIFGFTLDGSARVKRLKRLVDNSLVVLSDNPAFEPEVIDPSDREFELLGQVVWSGHVWR